MEIFINGRFLTQRITGVQRYALEMTRALDQLIDTEKALKKYHFIVLTPKNVIQRVAFKNIDIIQKGSFSGHLWEQIELPYYARNSYLLNFCNCAPILKQNQTVTIHDAAVSACPAGFSWKFRTWYKIMFSILGRRLDTIFTVSEFSRDELNKYFGIPRDKIYITYNGVEHLARVKPDEHILQKLPKKYVLAVASQNPNKNFQLIRKTALLLPDIDFVIVGGFYTHVSSKVQSEEMKNVHYTGYVSDEELVALYQHADVFVYPSLYEGFGIPPLEAMYFGCPVIVSNRASLPEACGEAAVYCDPYDMNDLKRDIEEFVNNLAKRAEYVRLGTQRIKLFQWSREARKIYKNCLRLECAIKKD